MKKMVYATWNEQEFSNRLTAVSVLLERHKIDITYHTEIKNLDMKILEMMYYFLVVF